MTKELEKNKQIEQFNQEDDFVILRNADKFIMYKKIDNIIIK